MLRKLRARLTFSNVVSVIALVAALGLGTAWALERNSVESKHIAPNEVGKADTSNALRLECPGGTRYHEGTCIETVVRSPDASWVNAFEDCRDEGRHTPTMAELLSFRLEPGITLGTPGEWTSQIDEDSSFAIAVGGAGTLNSAATATTMPYRCVTRPKD